ncbi:MAG: hypothetical protein L3K15_05385 [Thermoplasmata archaeon]|nr:hypothetical protein [Thermoplasmata archaeon]
MAVQHPTDRATLSGEDTLPPPGSGPAVDGSVRSWARALALAGAGLFAAPLVAIPLLIESPGLRAFPLSVESQAAFVALVWILGGFTLVIGVAGLDGSRARDVLRFDRFPGSRSAILAVVALAVGVLIALVAIPSLPCQPSCNAGSFVTPGPRSIQRACVEKSCSLSVGPVQVTTGSIVVVTFCLWISGAVLAGISATTAIRASPRIRRRGRAA